MKKQSDQEKQKKIAKERIVILFQKAQDIFSTNTSRADRYVSLARRIAMKTNLRLEKEQKRRFCKHCYSFLVSGINATIRTRNKTLITYCQKCKKYTRIPLTKKRVKK